MGGMRGMKETEYIFLSNLMRLRNAINILRNVMPGKEYGINQRSYKSAMKTLYNILDEVQKKELIDE